MYTKKNRLMMAVLAGFVVFFISLINGDQFDLTEYIETELSISPTETPKPTKKLQGGTIDSNANSLSAIVTRVVDGDTLIVTFQEQEERVRLIGIDTPESVDPRKPVECYAKEASDYMNTLVLDRQITLNRDDSQQFKDRYGRILAYVYRDDGLFVNQHMIEEGFAFEYTYSNPYQFQSAFKQAQETAKQNNKGLWGVENCSN